MEKENTSFKQLLIGYYYLNFPSLYIIEKQFFISGFKILLLIYSCCENSQSKSKVNNTSETIFISGFKILLLKNFLIFC